MGAVCCCALVIPNEIRKSPLSTNAVILQKNHSHDFEELFVSRKLFDSHSYTIHLCFILLSHFQTSQQLIEYSTKHKS